MQIEAEEWLPSFSAESFVFQVAIQKHQDYNTQNYNFSCCVWM